MQYLIFIVNFVICAHKIDYFNLTFTVKYYVLNTCIIISNDK